MSVCLRLARALPRCTAAALLTLAAGAQAQAQPPAPPEAAAAASVTTSTAAGTPAPAPATKAASGAATAKPARASTPVSRGTTVWATLNPAQQRALAPLAGKWDTLSEPQRRKWIALAENFGRLPPAEQAKLHSRMTDWVALSPQQRAQARLNFGETQQLSGDEKKAKWEAYQALPAEEKRKLAATAPVSKTPSTAAALRPVPADKLAATPPPGNAVRQPRIVAGTPASAPAAGTPAVPAAPAAGASGSTR